MTDPLKRLGFEIRVQAEPAALSVGDAGSHIEGEESDASPWIPQEPYAGSGRMIRARSDVGVLPTAR
jgi:hypothetical protein